MISLTAGLTPVVNATLSNAATGEQMTIINAALAPGQTLVLDSIYRQATIGAIDALRYVDGHVPAPGSGSKRTDARRHVRTLTNLQVAFRDRWY